VIHLPSRRDLLLAGLALPCIDVLTSPQRRVPASSEPTALSAEAGELVYVGRDPVRIKVSPKGTGRLAMITQDVSPGTSIPVHLHEKEDEIIFIQAGTGEAMVGDVNVALEPGSMLFVPQGTWHAGRNTARETLKWIAIYSPSGFEGYFREIGRPSPEASANPLTPEERQARDDRYGIRYR
jgi:mannose-6-phosphate isomerase-like protein (cupin superfamily)